MHTAGKWRFKPWSEKEGQIIAGKGDAATLVAGAVLNQDGPLLSAAPDLLEALKEVRRVGDDKLAFRSEWVAAVAKADAAIARATGAGA
jgi:hypothetical protein